MEIREIDRPHADQAADNPLSLMDLSTGPGTDTDAVVLVRAGMPTSVIEGLAGSLGISQRELLAVSTIAPATLARRRNAGGCLTPAESDRV